MDASFWVSAAGLGVTGIGGAIGYGVLKQQVTSLKEAATKIDARVTTCEAAHLNTSNEINALRVDVAVLRTRSEATIASLDRIERHIEQIQMAPAQRSRAAPK